MAYNELKLSTQSEKALNQMLGFLHPTGIIERCYAFKARVKSEVGLVEKAERKNKEKPPYMLQNITDVIGIRFVTLFRFEMPLIFCELLDILTHKHKLSFNPFKLGAIEEIIFYHTDPNDYLINVLKDHLLDYRLNLKKSFETKISDKGYSSIHIVTRILNNINELNKSEIEYFIPVEIQIRTVFEDAWGEIDHKYKYETNRSDKGSSHTYINSDFVSKHLLIMKKYIDACAEYADTIHFEATRESLDKDTAKVKSIVPDDGLIPTFETLGIESKYIELFKTARKLRVKAANSMDTDRSNGIAIFLQAYEILYELSKAFEVSEIIPDNKGKYLFYYYVRMNEALCLLSTDAELEVRKALNLYEHLADIFPDFILVKMRLAQAYGKNQLLGLALEKFEEADEYVQKFEQEGCKYSENLPELDYNHIKTYLPKIYGYQLWRKSKLIDPSNRKNASKIIYLLGKAYHMTLKALGRDKQIDVEIHNNLLYYGIASVALSEKFRIKIGAEIVGSIDKYLGLVEKSCEIDKCNDIDLLDTMLRAYDLKNRKDKINTILINIFHVIEKTLATRPWDREEILEIEKYAYGLQEKYRD